jgi:hypothetical protein
VRVRGPAGRSTSAIVTKVTTEGAFDTAASDTSAATVLGWINESYRQMVAAAEWLRALRTIGTTVANQELYDLADDVVQVSRVAVNGNDRWKIVDVEELLDLKLSGGSGAVRARRGWWRRSTTRRR